MPDEPDASALAADGAEVVEGTDPPTLEEWVAYSQEGADHGDR